MLPMIALVGQQPLPILLPILHELPPVAVLAHTDLTRQVAENVKELVQGRSDLTGKVNIQLCHVDPYDVERVRQALLKHLRDQGWEEGQVQYNLTGGTKTMILAAYELARHAGASYFYLESERGQNVLYRYDLHQGQSILANAPVRLGGLLTIEDYLHAHGFFKFCDSREDSSDFLPAVWDEVMAMQRDGILHEARQGINLYGSGNVDVDLAVRFENQVAVAEVKSGHKVNSLDWIKQLNTAARHTTLGTYTKRFGIVDRQPQKQYCEIAELQEIQVIVLESFSQDGAISLGDRDRLRAMMGKAFGRGKP